LHPGAGYDWKCTTLTSAAKLARGETSALAEVMRAKAAAIARVIFMVTLIVKDFVRGSFWPGVSQRQDTSKSPVKRFAGPKNYCVKRFERKTDSLSQNRRPPSSLDVSSFPDTLSFQIGSA